MAALIEDVREEYGLPAIGVLVQSQGELRLLATSGVRKQGEAVLATDSDLWHIGSNTKAMTATLIGTFVEEGAIRFDTRLEEVFPELVGKMRPDAARMTIEQILTHRAGLPPEPFEGPEDYFATLGDVTDLQEQRSLVFGRIMSSPLLFEPGTDFAYSNAGFIAAGAIAESLGGKAWEELLEERVLAPLGITSVGFGAPGNVEQLDQPWGHRPSASGLIPTAPDDEEHQNPPIYGSAGLVHISLQDWALFATEHLMGRRGEGKLLSKEVYERLHAPPGGESGFAMGWGVLIEEGQPTMLTHNGSDGNWFAEIRIYPPTDVVFLMVTNDGREDDAAKAAFAEIRAALNQAYKPFRD